MPDISLTVCSSDSKDIHLNNAPHDFTVNLKPQYNLEGHWKIGLREISHPANVINIGEPNTVVFHWLKQKELSWGEHSISLPAESSFLTPEDVITYINESCTHLSRRPEPTATTYKLSEVLRLSNHRNWRVWSNENARIMQNREAMRDIPLITLEKKFRGRQGSIVVTLKDSNATQYFQKTYKLPRHCTRHVMSNP